MSKRQMHDGELAKRAGETEGAKLVQSVLPMDQNPNFSVLCGHDEYGAYFRLLQSAFGILSGWSKLNEADIEQRAISDAIRRLLNTAVSLRYKYAFDNDHFLRIDLSESGFPNRLEIDALQADFANQSESLRSLSSPPVLKKMLLDHLFKYQEDPPEILKRLGERHYLDSLSPDRLFFPFTPGELTRQKVDANCRHYAFSWHIYDFSTNLPYVQIISFTQDADEEPLEGWGESWKAFLAEIANDGSRAMPLNLLASAIDEHLPSIHPKMLKRICLGPIYARFLMENFEDQADPYQKALKQLLEEDGEEGDFILLLDDEIVISAGERIIGKLFRKSVRQTFFVPENELDCYSRGVSQVHRYAILPHSLWQAAAARPDLNHLGFTALNPITFNREGRING